MYFKIWQLGAENLWDMMNKSHHPIQKNIIWYNFEKKRHITSIRSKYFMTYIIWYMKLFASYYVKPCKAKDCEVLIWKKERRKKWLLCLQLLRYTYCIYTLHANISCTLFFWLIIWVTMFSLLFFLTYWYILHLFVSL